MQKVIILYTKNTVTMKNFMDENFLLQTETAQKLYHEHAAKMPIIDYHCHLIPQMVADDYKFKSLTEIWLGGDHYKWRAMRTNGVDERYCTGKDTTDWEKFEKWAETVPYTFRNPLEGIRYCPRLPEYKAVIRRFRPINRVPV